MKHLSKGLLIVFCGFALAPIAWHLVSSLKGPMEIGQIPPTLIPHDPTFANYRDLFDRRPFGAYALNSLVIASLSALLCVSAGSLMAYRLSRASTAVRSGVSAVLLVLAFFPPIVFVFPLYEVIRMVGLINHPWSLIAPYAALNLPMAVWLLTGYFRGIPMELEEAAAMDGLTRWQTYWRIILPLSMPALATAGVLTFVFSWNEFMLALTFINAEPAKTATVAVATLSGAFVYEIPWGLIAAGVIVSSAPLVILIAFFQKRIVAGLTAGSGR